MYWSSRSLEGTKTAAKWLYQWKTEYAHLTLQRGRLPIFTTMGQILPCAHQKPRLQWPNQPGGSHGQRFVHTTTGSHSGLPNKYLGNSTNQSQTSHYPLKWWNDYTVPVISIPWPTPKTHFSVSWLARKLLVCTSGIPRMKFETSPNIEGRQSLNKESGHSRLIGSRVNKQGKYEACLGQLQE